jgi:hypothetical protein
VPPFSQTRCGRDSYVWSNFFSFTLHEVTNIIIPLREVIDLGWLERNGGIGARC